MHIRDLSRLEPADGEVASQPFQFEREPTPALQPSLIESLSGAYATLLKTQRTASAAYVRWAKAYSRSHEFVWLDKGRETLLMNGSDLVVEPESPIYSAIQKMMATMELNPYERELQYGFPYVIGQVAGTKFRAPLLTIPISIAAHGASLAIKIIDDVVRFNSLPFRTEADTSARELALSRLINDRPELPLSSTTLQHFCKAVARELGLRIDASLDGQLRSHPEEPTHEHPLTILDHAACFIAPKTSYFLVSDLGTIGRSDPSSVASSSLGWLIGKRPAELTSDPPEAHSVLFPFAANPSQRRIAHLADDPRSRITVVQGPPGTGKSLTIANLACHLLAKGKKVLITSQKDKALQVVDETLSRLNLAQLPMTLLRKDRESRKQLRDRLDSIQKLTSAEECRETLEAYERAHQETVDSQVLHEALLRLALNAEHEVVTADQHFRKATGILPRTIARLKLHNTVRRAERIAPERSDAVGKLLSSDRQQLRDLACCILRESANYRVSTAMKTERNHLKEVARLLGRDEANFKTFRVFDRLKSEPERCQMLLKILPCWIMTPDDVARLFPCIPNFFDVVIIDEASQCDLPSMFPVLYRARQAVVVGDSKQMQAQRFAFTDGGVASQAWAHYGMDNLDPERWLDPAKTDLLQLACIRMDEEAFLDEHYRSLPDIIGFSNERWYSGKLRIMRDADDRRHGDHNLPAISLHRVNGQVRMGTQENKDEAVALVKHLCAIVKHPAYCSASIGIICLFEQQMHLINDLISEQIPEEVRARHKLVVINPDGFQGDERNIIFYSLSYDGDGMGREQLSARQADRAHIQGMLNVAFTRACDEIHIFHSAEISDFGMSTGVGTIKDWLAYCQKREQAAVAKPKGLTTQLPKAQSEFEQQVLIALSNNGLEVFSQYPSCGYFIDIVVQSPTARLAIECDGEYWHLDEHGQQKIEDLERQEVLERAGWKVLRIPYRSWRENPSLQVMRVLAELRSGENVESDSSAKKASIVGRDAGALVVIPVDKYEKAIIDAIRQGLQSRCAVYKFARAALGYKAIRAVLRSMLDGAVDRLQKKGSITVEEDEIFFKDQSMRDCQYEPSLPEPIRPEPQPRSYRRWCRGARNGSSVGSIRKN